MQTLVKIIGLLFFYIFPILLLFIHPVLFVVAIIVFGFFDEICEQLRDFYNWIIELFRPKANEHRVEIKQTIYPPEIQKWIDIRNEIDDSVDLIPFLTNCSR